MAALATLPASARAALWMIGTTLCFTFMALGGRELSDTMTAFEVSFFRAFGGFLIVVVLLWRTGFAQLRTRRATSILSNSARCSSSAAAILWMASTSLRLPSTASWPS